MSYLDSETYERKIKLLTARFGNQAKLAKELGTSQQQVSRWANGDCEPNYEYAYKIDKLFWKKPTI